MRVVPLITASLLSLLATPANAATTITWAPGSNTLGNNQVIFQSFDTLGPLGLRSEVFDADVPGQGARPNFSTGGYLAVGTMAVNGTFGFGSYLLNLPIAAPVVTFLLGSLDSFNAVTLTYANGLQDQYVGNQIIGGAAFVTDGRVRYDVGTGDPSRLIQSIEFFSSQASFEIDDVASAAPEPATWLMMILGFGLVGAGLRRRRETGTFAKA